MTTALLTAALMISILVLMWVMRARCSTEGVHLFERLAPPAATAGATGGAGPGSGASPEAAGGLVTSRPSGIVTIDTAGPRPALPAPSAAPKPSPAP